MENSLFEKVKKLNELYKKKTAGEVLNEMELKEQQVLREDLINYFKYAIDKHSSLDKKVKQ